MERYWSEFHSNIHSKDLDNLAEWNDFAKQMLDFWAPVYYPYFINHKNGFSYEDTLDQTTMTADFNKIKQFIRSEGDEFIVYPAYEWQGDGSDGDHNVFHKGLAGSIDMPLTYRQLWERADNDVIGIPHHTGYKAGHRGKNWETHCPSFSPVTEIYSSHGSSEKSNAAIPLNVHIHMGPRGEDGTFNYAIKKGIKVGVIASGDNHTNPAISGNGFFAVYAEEYSRSAIFENIKKRHTYGVSRSKIEVDYRINDFLMGSEIKSQQQNRLIVKVRGSSEIDRIEVYRNGFKEKTFSWPEVKPEDLAETVTFKFELECGWGPDTRVFPDIHEKDWRFELNTKGRIISYEKCFTSPGSSVEQVTDQKVAGVLHTVKKTANGNKLAQKNYLNPYIQNQSIIFEISDRLDHELMLMIDGRQYAIPIRKIMNQAILETDGEEVEKLLSDRFDFNDYYREDPWWHNAYKILLHRAYTDKSYCREVDYVIERLETDEDSFYVKVIQTNGDTAWTSPIWVKK